MPSWCWLVLLARPSIMAAKLAENFDSSPRSFPPSTPGLSSSPLPPPSGIPSASNSPWTSPIIFDIRIFNSGRQSRMWCMSIELRFLARLTVPHLPMTDLSRE